MANDFIRLRAQLLSSKFKNRNDETTDFFGKHLTDNDLTLEIFASPETEHKMIVIDKE